MRFSAVATMEGRRSTGVVAAVAALALLISGCSGGSAKPRGAQTSREFARAYTAAETAFQERTTALQQKGKTALSHGEDAVLAVYQQLLTSTESAAREFDELSPPDSVKTAYAALVTALHAQVTALQQVLKGAHSHDNAGTTRGLRSYASSLSDFLQATKSLQLAVPGLAVTSS